METFAILTAMSANDCKCIVTSGWFISPLKLRGDSFIDPYFRFDWNRNIQLLKTDGKCLRSQHTYTPAYNSNKCQDILN